MNKTRYTTTIVLLFAVIQLFSQTNTKQSVLGSYHNKSLDTTEIETKLLPSSLRELWNSNDSDNKPEDELPSASIAIDKSQAVGTIIGTIDVTATGGARYQTSIEIPQGIAGFEPAVAIGYNSQASNGLMGYGWNLAAYSAISRCGKTYYHDNAAEAPQLSSSDNLMLDGQRLMLISGQNLVNGAKYRMEFDPFTDVAFKIVNSYSCFIVRSKDGTTREFGSTANSNIEVTGGNTLFWLLSKAVDKSGNTITYNYEEVTNNGEFYLTKIQYAGNRSIQFAYETRNDKQKSYFAGVAVNNNKILKSISTYINQTRIKQYQFNYVYDGFYSKLTELIEKGQNNEQYNSTVVNYGNSGVGQEEYLSTLSEKREGNMPLFIDFNGDGKADFLSYPEKTSYTTSDVATLFIAENTYGDVAFYKKCTLPIQSSSGVFQSFILADLNGDGKMDVVNISKALNGTFRYNYYMFDGEKFSYDYKGFNTNGNNAITGDFNGDGKQELLVIANQKVFDGDGNEIASGGIDDWGSVYIEDYYPNNRYLCDFNGNGKTDILVMNASGGWVYELNGKSFVRLNSFNTASVKNYHFPYFGDFNGDGKTDVLTQNVQSGNYDDVSILFSTGKGFVKQIISNADIRAKVQVADFNKDGKSDIFHMEIVNNAVRMKVGTFNGTDFTTAYYTSLLKPSDFDVPLEYDNFLFPVDDFDGDGRAEFCCARYVDTYIIHSFTDNQTLLAKTITNGLGAYTSFEYASITDKSVCSNTGNNVSFPIIGNTYPLYVVTNMMQSAGGYYESVTYRYKNPRIHVQGKGILGFSDIDALSYNQDRKIATKYGYNDYYYPFVSEQKITTRSGSSISSSVYENSYVSQGNKRVTPYIKKQTETDHLTGIVKTTECTATDSWGNPLTVITKYGNDVTETVTSTYINSGTDNSWIFSLPLSVERKTTKGSDNWIEKQSLEYNEKYLLAKSVNNTSNGTKKVSEDTFGYDAFGNATVQSTKPFSSTTALTTRYEYSPDGVYQTKKTDPISLTTSWTYNLLGQTISGKDPLNNTTTYEYDGMGRLVKTNYPDNTFASTTFTWGSTVANSVYCITETSSGKPTVKTYYDAFDRELRNSILRFDNTEIHTDTKYDNANRVSQESLPFRGSSASQWNTYSYDGYGRLSGLSYASGKSDTYTYSGTSITMTQNGIATEKKINSKGELVSVTDPAGKIAYNLRPDGQPSSIVAPGDVKTSFEYDEYGRQTAIIDPSAGKKIFSYDGAGYLKEEIDADNRKKTMSYDSYGRILSKELPEFKTSYVYNGNGQLTSESSANGTSQTYEYDNYGRLSKERDNGPDSKWLEKTYTYSFGNISSIDFVSQVGTIATEQYLYSNGYTSEIKLGTTSVWKLNAESTTGSPTSVTTGPVTRTYSFDPYGIPTGRSASSSSNGTFQNYTYSFENSKGNLLSRKDNTINIVENFTYDNLNRLTRFDGSMMEYDMKGNITGKSDVGNVFHYTAPNKPYAISEIEVGKNTAIPQRNQSVTYTSFERPLSISENGYEAVFTYDGSGSRKRMQLNNNGTNQLQRYYLGECYEADYGISVNKQILFVGGDAYSAPAVYVNQGSSWSLYYICRDYLGSITHLTNSSGTVTQENSYDAWGRLRNPATQVAYAPGEEPTLFLGRGYTGHEHLSLFGLVNMNARLYDPATGRFLSPDPFVQMPDFSQNFNRYSYAMNNPFAYVDEDGEFVHIIIGALIGGAVNLIYKAASGQLHSVKDGFAAFGIGAAAGGLGAATGGLAFAAAGGAAGGLGGFLAGAAGGAAGSAAMMPIQSVGNTLYFGDPMMTWNQYVFGVAGAGLTGGIANGAVAAANGNNFWTGKSVQFGRNIFSLNNTPTRPAPEMKLLDAPVSNITN